MLTTTATNLPRLMNCNGSRNMPASFASVDSDTTDRDEGNAADWLAEQVFAGADINALVNTKAFNGVIITADMADHVASYLAALHPGGAMQVETSYGTDAWRTNGRADHIAIVASPEDQREGQYALVVDDLKYGWRIVDPFENWTLISHAIGYCIFRQIQPHTVALRIHQPRPHHPDGKVREWRLSYDELLTYYARIVETLTNPSNNLVTGLPWCAGCRALATCPAARMSRMNIIDAASRTFSDQITSDALGYELDVIRTARATLEAHEAALQELTIHRIKKGEIFENYGLEKQYSHTRFKSGISAQALTAATGIDCVKPGTITPAEFKRRGGSQADYDALTERPMTGIKLIRASADQRARRALGVK